MGGERPGESQSKPGLNYPFCTRIPAQCRSMTCRSARGDHCPTMIIAFVSSNCCCDISPSHCSFRPTRTLAVYRAFVDFSTFSVSVSDALRSAMAAISRWRFDFAFLQLDYRVLSFRVATLHNIQNSHNFGYPFFVGLRRNLQMIFTVELRIEQQQKKILSQTRKHGKIYDEKFFYVPTEFDCLSKIFSGFCGG